MSKILSKISDFIAKFLWIILILVFSILFFVVIWFILDHHILPSQKFSNIGNEQWISFMTTYFSGILGGIISIIGISWQLNHQKKEEEKRVVSYIKYTISRMKNIGDLNKSENKNDAFIKELIKIELIAEYNSTLLRSHSSEKNKIVIIDEFCQVYFDKNLDYILKLKNKEDILELNNSLNKLNYYYNINFYSIKTKNVFIMNETNEDKIIEILRFYSNTLYYYANNYKLLSGEKNDITRFRLFIKNNYSSYDIKKFEFGKLEDIGNSEYNKLKLIVEFKKEFFKLIIPIVIGARNDTNKVFSDTLLECLLNEQSSNGLSLKIYDYIDKIEKTLT